jgi:transposase
MGSSGTIHAGDAMELKHARCAGLDVHKDSVVVCARIARDGGEVDRHHETFGTKTSDLLRLADWLREHRCTHVVMEATGVYWKPVWHILEGSFDLILANANHVRNVPGRKTDVNDSTWLADLAAHGLVRASFVPPTAIQEVRTLLRTRKQLVREKAQHVQRIQKTLEDANLKIASVAADILGVSGRAILNALVEGVTDPEALADLTRGRLKAARATIVESLRGRVRDSHRFLLKLHLDEIASKERSIAAVESEVEGHLAPFQKRVELLTTIPGVSDIVAQVIVSEIGIDMSRFPTSAHLISWAGLCPRSDESAGKTRSRRLRKGAPWLKTTLVQSAWSASRTKDTYLRAQFHRLRGRRGPHKAIMAVAASILTAVFHILRDGVAYRDLGADHFSRLTREGKARKLVRQLESLGFDVDIREVPQVA